MKVYEKIKTMSLDQMNLFLNLLLSMDPANIYCRYLCRHKNDKDGECDYEECEHVDDLREVLNADYDLLKEMFNDTSESENDRSDMTTIRDLKIEYAEKLKAIIFDAIDNFGERGNGRHVKLNYADIQKLLEVIVEMCDKTEDMVRQEIEERIVTGDIFVDPIEFALRKTMQQFEESDTENDKIIYESLRKSMAVWKSIKIHNLQIYGVSYEQFCEQCKTKTNIVFLTDDEMQDINKAMRIIKVMEGE